MIKKHTSFLRCLFQLLHLCVPNMSMYLYVPCRCCRNAYHQKSNTRFQNRRSTPPALAETSLKPTMEPLGTPTWATWCNRETGRNQPVLIFSRHPEIVCGFPCFFLMGSFYVFFSKIQWVFYGVNP